MHNQERSGLSCVSYPKGWVGEEREVKQMGCASRVPYQDYAQCYFVHVSSSHNSVHLALKTSLTGVPIRNFAVSNKWWLADKLGSLASKDQSFFSLSRYLLHNFISEGKEAQPWHFCSGKAVFSINFKCHCRSSWLYNSEWWAVTLSTECCHILSNL